jgi:hypothetical protein
MSLKKGNEASSTANAHARDHDRSEQRAAKYDGTEHDGHGERRTRRHGERRTANGERRTANAKESRLDGKFCFELTWSVRKLHGNHF